ncbi:MAG: anaerobic ribonucleoside-triphosphate reductase activating protein [Candidatus Tagabacteria bacterium CG09_land_8_20_14_0_10_41_14]|uniref:Anaerobic ribonucleoside-triphosphate reductase activating protein n=2 Tax=Candidatus Tagaibacteriota TaxID=1817918 RepID=A0A2H0WLG5_9BACT|nr:MAG: anaerobic ribonucleoside-triphosphate reductase activating protein [Candidatus Tagabacteria bacterium CG09_land_8_20_14_0_10_41_14]PJE73048.1 MAG: anaerobic ribonucleoside-triphosphate reductase activating protein [Candidatus Tagabacteria bacterium CG10_big_fil_rev_8_21_14_0_10_40_13]
MTIGGFQKFSLIDYPDKISAVVFTRGCNFRCPYCHNPELVDLGRTGSDTNDIKEKEIFSFLKNRRGKLDAVVITGGEPTLQPDLPEFIEKIKKMGFLIKMDTNGSKPKVIKKVIDSRLADYLAMDIKAPLRKYYLFSVPKTDLNSIRQSIELIMNSGVNYEFRTTVLKSLLAKEDILKIAELIKGSRLYVLQPFVSSKALDSSCFVQENYSDEEFEELRKTSENLVRKCLVR